MRLTKKEKKICKQYSRYDESGYVHCNQCPLVLNANCCICKKNISAKEYKENWK